MFRPFVLAMLLVPLLLSGCSGCADDKNKSGGAGIGVDEPASIRVRPDRLTFASTYIGVPATAEVEVANVAGDGGKTLVLGAVAIDPGSATEFVPGTLEVTELEPGEVVMLSVTYTPTGPGGDQAWLVIESNATNAQDGRVKLETLVNEGGLLALPDALDFGDVEPGEGTIKHTDIINTGSADVDLTWVGFDEDTSSDYSLVDITHAAGAEPADSDFEPTAQGTITLSPVQRVRIRVHYDPVNGDDDVGTLLVRTNLEGYEELEIPLQGSEPSPAIALIPQVLDFGPTEAAGRTETFVVRSVGNGHLVISEIAQALPKMAEFEVLNAPEEDLTVAPGAEHTVEVHFVPPQDETGIIEKKLHVYSDDPVQGETAHVLLRGQLDAPIISVIPDAMHFGAVATGQTARRELTITNVGSRELEVSEIVLADESHDDYGLADEANAIGTLLPGEARVFEATFMATRCDDPDPNECLKQGLVQVRSNDPFNPEVGVVLRGIDGGAPVCDVRAREPVKNYGLVGYGRNKILAVDFIGVGTSDCVFRNANLVNPNPLIPLTFTIEDLPDPRVIPSQGIAAVQVGYAPQRGGIFEEAFGLPQTATLVVTYEGPNAEGVVDQREVSVNLTGIGGASEIAVLPSDLDFGLVTLGCMSQTLSVTVYNTGIAEFSINEVFLGRNAPGDCGPEWELVDRPRRGTIVVPARPADIYVRYGPQDGGQDNCELHITSDAGNVEELVVPLRGEGTRVREQTDEYVQTSGQIVDVLFVVDNSGSMCDEEENLAANMDDFVQQAALFQVDEYQVGVVNTEIADDAIFNAASPDPDRGKLLGDPRIVNTANGGGGTAAQHVIDVGCNGAGAQESGLEAARLALSDPWIREEEAGDCNGDDGCQDGEECVAGKCVGWNRGFLRDEATLEVVFLSDEEDQSPARVSFYVDFLKSIKGFRNEGLLHASAIVGPPGGCQTNNGAADAGNRYIDVVEATNGSWHSICADDFGPALEEIGNRAFGLRVQFFLSRVPDPATITVTVEGAPRPDGWEFDEDSNSIIFDEAVVPEPGDEVTISYSSRCFR